MPVPRVEDVNASRVAKFTDAITQALGDAQMDVFRELVAGYEEAHDIPATDIAAAIAVLAQDGEPLLMEALPEPVERPRSGSKTQRSADSKALGHLSDLRRTSPEDRPAPDRRRTGE